MKQDPQPTKKKRDAERDLVDRLLEDNIKEEKRKQKAKHNARNNEGQQADSMNVIEEFKMLSKGRDIDFEVDQQANEKYAYSKMLTKK